MATNDFVTYNLNLPDKTGDCWDIFLNSLKINFSNFVQYKEGILYFLPGDTQEDIQSWIDSFECNIAEDEIYNSVQNIDINTVVRTVDPTIYENLSKDIIWVNKRTGEIFTCIDDTIDANIWRGTSPGKLIRPIPPADKLDFYDDGSCVGFYKLCDNARDSTGKYHGKDYLINYVQAYDGLVADSVKYNGTIKINLPFSNTTDIVVVAGWIKWKGQNATMPFGWASYDLYCYGGNLGFNTARGDLYGIDFRDYKNKWIYVVVEFKKGEVGNLFINGIKQSLSQRLGSFNSGSALIDDTFSIFGWKSGRSYRKFGEVGRVRIFNRALSDLEVEEITEAEFQLVRSLGGKV